MENKEFIAPSWGDGLPCQLGQLIPTESVSQSCQTGEKGPEQTALTKQL